MPPRSVGYEDREAEMNDLACCCDPARLEDGWIDSGCRTHGLKSLAGYQMRESIAVSQKTLDDMIQEGRSWREKPGAKRIPSRLSGG